MHRRQLIDPKIAEHHGRIVKTTGDGLLAEFPIVVAAVRCAAEVEGDDILATASMSLPASKRLPSPAASASPAQCATTFAAISSTRSRIGTSKA